MIRLPKLAALGCALLTIAGCDPGEEPEPDTGQLRMGVSGSNAAGTVFRLRDATFQIGAPGGVIASVSTEDSPTTLDVLTQPLPVGDYTVNLLDGWRLEEWDEVTDVATDVEAELTSDNPVDVTIVAASTTSTVFTFFVAGAPVSFGEGLEIDIDIASTCSPLDPGACESGETCAPIGDSYGCVASTGSAEELEGCEWAGCAPGYICAPAGAHPACDDCCVAYCDVLAAGTCDDASSGDTCIGLESPVDLSLGVCFPGS